MRLYLVEAQTAALKVLAGKAAVSSASLAQRVKGLDGKRVPDARVGGSDTPARSKGVRVRASCCVRRCVVAVHALCGARRPFLIWWWLPGRRAG